MIFPKVRFRRAFTAVQPLVLGVLASCSVALAEIRVNQPDSGNGSADGELVATTGIDSRLIPTQHAFVTDESAWKRLWRSHIGRLPGGPIPNMPKVDFSDSIVVRRETNVGDDKQPRKRLDVVARYSPTENQATEKRDSGPHAAAKQMLNIGFAHDPGAGHYDGVVGTPGDVWNFVSVGTTAKDYMRNSDTTSSTARLRISRHDGAWGIAGQSGIFHGYIYDNCRCKDLEATILDLQSGRFRAYVYAHGDAPNQNARVELQVAGESWGEKATVKDGTPGYRSRPMAEGAQYVTFDFEINTGDEVKIISHRDGSSYSMFNAIQIVPLGQLQHAGTTASSVERGVR